MYRSTLSLVFCVFVLFFARSKSFATPYWAGSDSVNTIIDLSALVTLSTTVTVVDLTRGGTFNYSNVGPVDYGIVFPRANGGYWVRQTDSSAYSNWYKDSASTDSANIQRVISSRKKYIYINPGTYYIADIVAKTSSTNIIGLGTVVWKKNPGNAANHSIFKIQNSTDTLRNVTVSNIYFQFSPSTNTGTDKLYLLLMGNDSRYADNIKMSNCTFDSSGNGFRSMVSVGGNHNMQFDNCVFKNSNAQAMIITSPLLDGLSITNCTFTNWACLPGNDQYSCIAGNGGTFKNIYISNSSFINVNGNKFTLEITGKNYNDVFANNYFNGNGRSANGISGPFWANCTFRGNTLTNGDGGHRSGFELVGYNCTVDSNLIDNGCIIISGDSTTIYATAAESPSMGSGFVITRNTISSSANRVNSLSISIGSNNGKVSRATINNNALKNYATGNSQCIGFTTTISMDSIIIRNNTLEDSAHLTSIRLYPNTINNSAVLNNIQIFSNTITDYNNPNTGYMENCAIRFDSMIGMQNCSVYDVSFSGYQKMVNTSALKFTQVQYN